MPDAKPDLAKNILGGEVAMWSEQVSGLAVEGKLWPRGSALGERLWADPDTDWKAAEVNTGSLNDKNALELNNSRKAINLTVRYWLH